MRSTSKVCSSMKAWMKIVFTRPSPACSRSSSSSARSSGYISVMAFRSVLRMRVLSGIWLKLGVAHDVGNGDDVERVVVAEVGAAVARVGGRLEHQRQDEVALEEQPDAVADLVVVDAAGHGGHDRRPHAGLLEIRECALLQ